MKEISKFDSVRFRMFYRLFGAALLIAVAVAAVPPFLAMPPWGDVTLYDVAAREVRTGGMHYRDVFDTNPPGFVWSLVGIRSIVGSSYEVLRAVDLCVAAAIAAGLASLIRPTPAIWFFVAVALFYPFQSEFNHIQRDVWMMLPAVIATVLRTRRKIGSVFWPSVLEGMLWGCAVWFKPHMVVPAMAVWLATFRMNGATGRTVAIDFLGQLTGGLLIGGLGTAYLVSTGTWPHMMEIMTQWNPEYAGNLFAELSERLPWNINYFGIWDLLNVAAIPLAILDLCRRDPQRRALAALYLGWYLQAFLLQRFFPYVHVPEIILALAVISNQRIPIGFGMLAWFAVQSVLWQIPGYAAAVEPSEFLTPHPLFRKHLYSAWPQCLCNGSSPALRDELGHLNSAHCGTDWVALERIADFLRTADLHDRELICWHDGTHPLYLMLNLKPGIRYMHLGTAWSFKSKREQIAEEVRAANARFVVSDLRVVTPDIHEANGPGDGGKWYRLPSWVPALQRDTFPWNQKIVFRSGRYIVHEIEKPLGRIHIASEGDE